MSSRIHFLFLPVSWYVLIWELDFYSYNVPSPSQWTMPFLTGSQKKNLHSLLTCFLISTYYTTESNIVSEVSQTLMGSFTCPEINGREKQCNSWGQKSNKTELAQCQGRDTMRINMSQRQSSIFSASRKGNQREMSHCFTSGECEPWAPQSR